MSVRDLRDPDCDEDYFLVFHQEKGFQMATKREMPLRIVQDTASQGRIYFISFLQVHCSLVLLSMILEARVFQLCPCFISSNLGGVAESAGFLTLLFAPMSRLLIYILALCSACL